MLRYANMYHKQIESNATWLGWDSIFRAEKQGLAIAAQDVYSMGIDTVAGKLTGEERCRQCSKANLPAVFDKNI